MTALLEDPPMATDDPQGPGPKASLEQSLAEQANAAIAAGKDPKLVTERLGVMVKHLRENPNIAEAGSSAIQRGADPGLVAARTWQLASSASGNINLTGVVPPAPGVTAANQPAEGEPKSPGVAARVRDLVTDRPIKGAPPVVADASRVGPPPDSKGTPLPPDSWRPSGIAAALLRHGVNPMLDSPLQTAIGMGGGVITAIPMALGAGKDITQYGAQKAAELSLDPATRALAEQDPPRIPGGRAAVEAAMFAVPALVHGGLRAMRGPEANPIAQAFGDIAKESAGIPPVEDEAALHKFIGQLARGVPEANRLQTSTIPKPEGFVPGDAPIGVAPREVLADQVGPNPLVKVAPKVAGKIEGLETTQPVEPPSRVKPLAGAESLADEAARHAEYDKAVNDAATEYDERIQEEQTRKAALRALTGVRRRPAPVAEVPLSVEHATPDGLPSTGRRPDRVPFTTPDVGRAPEPAPVVPERGAVTEGPPVIDMPKGPDVPRNVFGPKESGMAAVRQRATEFARANLIDKTFTNSVTGWDVRLSKDAIDHTLFPKNTANWHEAATSIAALPDLIRNADIVESQPTRGADKAADVPFHHRLTASFSVDGQPHTATLTVRELTGALDKKLYTVKAIKVEPDVTEPVPIGTPPWDQHSGPSSSVPNLAESRAPGESFAMGGREGRIPAVPRRTGRPLSSLGEAPNAEPGAVRTAERPVDPADPAYKGPVSLYRRLSDDALAAEYRSLHEKLAVDQEQAVAPLWDADREARAVDQIENRRRPDGSLAAVDRKRLATLQMQQGEGYGVGRHTFESAAAEQRVASYTRHIAAIEHELSSRGMSDGQISDLLQEMRDAKAERAAMADDSAHGDADFDFGEPPKAELPRQTVLAAESPKGEPTGEPITTNAEKFAPEFRGQVQDALDAAADRGAEREVVPIAQGLERAKQLAQDIGADPLAIDPKKVGRMSGEEIVAMRSAAQQHMAQITEWSKMLADPTLPIEQRTQLDYLIREAKQARDNLIEGVSRAASQKGRDLNFLKQMAQHSLDPDVWEAQAKALAGDRVLSDDVIAETRRLAQAALEACG